MGLAIETSSHTSRFHGTGSRADVMSCDGAGLVSKQVQTSDLDSLVHVCSLQAALNTSSLSVAHSCSKYSTG
ncbi:hypothetical protein TNCV_357231 [Trichonephila clavipes]|nr:hypothetical protein TNCV_357231 [Trichonephila clavipes]